jgi:hypothetical protein
MIKTLSHDKSLELIRRGRLARLACITNGEPYIVPVNYAFDGEGIIVHSLPGRKIDAMRANPRVCFQVDEIDDDLTWKSVLAYGRYEELVRFEEKSRALNRLLSRFPQLTPVEATIAYDAGTPLPIVFRVYIESLTGLSEGY